ncbi:S53 family peptidase [Sulfuracidifex tepidarius]|uniref:Peptidase S53 domain-containing protein n=1 Tax=Sulfuracidifex tepidarius TaxID=1294262 RepID=A0A510E5K1_9CREN|nr:protease pro-enzyme activation domain-containing protein [Sulfuracidifex tepidarius]BBG27717.1 hypothetical protein IC007_2271 [Sulfuracidifex tepidarius]
MYKYIGILAISLFSLSIIPIAGAFSSAGTAYVGPNLQGNEMDQLPSNQEICVFVMIPPKNMNELMLIAQEVANHQIPPLSKQEMNYMFGDVKKESEVVSYLKQSGFNVTFSSPFSVIAVGNASLVDKIFHTSLSMFRDASVSYYKPTVSPTIPSPLRGTFVGGLTNFTEFQPQYVTLGSPTTSQFPAQVPGSQFSALMYTPQELQGAYNVTGPEGKNVTVVVLDAYGDPEIEQDVKAFDSIYHLPNLNLTITPVGPYHPLLGVLTGWDEEVALDVEAVHSMAPYAKIDLVVASNAGSALYEAIDLIVSEDLGQVVDMSFGIPENEVTATGFYYYENGQPQINYPWVDYYFALGSAEGISFFAASGDDGAYGGTPTYYGGVSFPSSSPFVTSVGGTSLFVNTTSGEIGMPNSTASYGYETAWSVEPQYENPETSTVSSDGGFSTLFPVPWYQIPVTHSDSRTTPDVSADANPYTGMEIIVNGQRTVIGGTSLSTQLWGGVAADVISFVKHPIGLFNPYLYEIYQNSTEYNEAFHPVTLGFNGEYLANSSYNLVTGMGSPNVGELEQVMETLVKEPRLSISVSTFAKNITYPWYPYSSNFTIVASISTPNSTTVMSGNFVAYIFTLRGFLLSVPLSFNGSYWVATVYVNKGYPPNVWSVVVNGTYGGITGTGFVDIDVGDGINVLSQEGYIGISSPFTYEVCIYQPNGSPVELNSVKAYFTLNSRDIFNVTMFQTSTPGLYEGQGEVIPPTPQGAYVIYVNTSGASVYSWDVIGGFIYGAVLTPVNDGGGSINVGETFAVIASAYDREGLGLFTGNDMVYIYNDQGKLVYSTTMVPAPDVDQYYIYNLFGYQEANITLPSNFTTGFYKLIISSEINTSVGMCMENFTTGFYVSPQQLTGKVYTQSILYQGENVTVYANITYPNGTEVTQGEFTVTMIPQQSLYNSINEEFDYGVPMQYNFTIHEWEARVTVPSVMSREGLFSVAGPFSVVLSGTSSLGNNVVSNSTVFVEPYTYEVMNITSPTSVTSVYSPEITVYHTTGNITDSTLENLIADHASVVISSSKLIHVKAVDSNVTLKGSDIGGGEVAFTLINSSLTLIDVNVHDVKFIFNLTNSNVSEVGALFYNYTNLSTVPAPRVVSVSPINVTTNSTFLKVELKGYDLRVTSLTLNGEGVKYHVGYTSSGAYLAIPFSNLPGGLYHYDLQVTENGLPYNLSFDVYNSYPQVKEAQLDHSISSVNSSVSTLDHSIYIAYAIGVIGIILALVSLFLRVRK